MQHQRRDDYAGQSPPSKFREQRREYGLDPYAMPRRDVLERPRRSLSPRKMEGQRGVLRGDRRSSSAERRDYGWEMGGVRGGGVRSRSPQYEQAQKRPHRDEGVSARDLPSHELHRKYDFVEFLNKNADVNTGLKHDYEYKHTTSRMVSETGLGGGKLYDVGGHERLDHKSMALEESVARGSFTLPRDDLGPTSKYFEGRGRSFPTSSYADPPSMGKLSDMESLGQGEKYMFHSSGVSYPTVPPSQSMNIMGAAQFNNFMGTGMSRTDLSRSYRGVTDQYLRSSGTLSETFGASGYVDRSNLDSARFPEREQKDVIFYSRDTFSPTRENQNGYLHGRPGGRMTDGRGYPSDNLHERMALFEQAEDEHKRLLRRPMMDREAELVDPVGKRVENTEFSYRDLKDNSLWETPPMHKETFSEYLNMSKLPTTSKQSGEYLAYGSAQEEFGRGVTRDQHLHHMAVSRDHVISHARLEYGYGRDASPSDKERLQRSPEIIYEDEMHRVPGRTHGREPEELYPYDLSDRALKRKYVMDEELSGHNSRSTLSSRLSYSIRNRDLDSRSGEWHGQDASGSFKSKNVGYGRNRYRREERTFDGAERHKDSAYEDGLSSHDRDIRPHKPRNTYLKGHMKSGSSTWYNASYGSNKKNVLPRPRNVWMRGKDDNVVEKSEGLRNSAKSEPPEDSEEFKLLVHKAFLTFSKKMNENTAIRKRYKDQGRAGSLFCIVCGQSSSKDFVDTQRLATHAFMSHKVGLRAQHLGLHKAICVLLGWNTVVAPDTNTWVPDAISSAEALAQKEDLILWPPVVIIHNSSISGDPESRTIISVDALGDFLRGKGFAGGKMKICLGKPANHSVLVVKFLGTFSGIRDAEELHKYFAEKKHGRRDFDQVFSSKGKGKGNKSGEAEKHGPEAERVLYGYMGIAEDLDKVDMESKKKCTIKSKEEIQDIANAPVKPE